MDPPELASKPPRSRIGAALNSALELRVLGWVMLGCKLCVWFSATVALMCRVNCIVTSWLGWPRWLIIHRLRRSSSVSSLMLTVDITRSFPSHRVCFFSFQLIMVFAFNLRSTNSSLNSELIPQLSSNVGRLWFNRTLRSNTFLSQWFYIVS